ncbi:hypothetical protein MO973_27240 [Paenibacillus sp. TRM 82003]|nr:hypothetical protein [Paenibacillus sp. TRM 82003]
MAEREPVLEKLRGLDARGRVGSLKKASDETLMEEFASSGVKFAAIANGGDSPLENAYYAAIGKLFDCIVPNAAGRPILQEGGVYLGCWLESTGTINAELLSRFLPSAAKATFEQFADLQREDGLLPYKITASGPVFKQIQLVTPLARSVWNHERLHGTDEAFAEKMYAALSRYDAWLETYRNTRGTGCVEAFCTFDTGHDLSARFWHVPDTPHRNDPAQYDPDSPILPFLAPDLTANVYCSREYLARMASAAGDEAASAEWSRKAKHTLDRLVEHCYDEDDGFFYDVDRAGRFVRIQTDVLLRVLACEVGDDAFFAASLRRYLLNTRKFFSKYPFTSVAMDDPRFDPHSTYNTWSGAVNFLSIIRAAHAFERHGCFVEFTWVLRPIISAISRMERFGQCLSPWTGDEGYTEAYSPAILCALDFVERLCGIVPSTDGQLWFNGLLPYAMDHGISLADSTAYSRTVDGRAFELANTATHGEIWLDGERLCRFPSGVRVVTDRKGGLQAVVGLSAREIEGEIEYRGAAFAIRVGGNETLRFDGGSFRSESGPGVVLPEY